MAGGLSASEALARLKAEAPHLGENGAVLGAMGGEDREGLGDEALRAVYLAVFGIDEGMAREMCEPRDERRFEWVARGRARPGVDAEDDSVVRREEELAEEGIFIVAAGRCQLKGALRRHREEAGIEELARVLDERGVHAAALAQAELRKVRREVREGRAEERSRLVAIRAVYDRGELAIVAAEHHLAAGPERGEGDQ